MTNALITNKCTCYMKYDRPARQSWLVTRWVRHQSYKEINGKRKLQLETISSLEGVKYVLNWIVLVGIDPGVSHLSGEIVTIVSTNIPQFHETYHSFDNNCELLSSWICQSNVSSISRQITNSMIWEQIIPAWCIKLGVVSWKEERNFYLERDFYVYQILLHLNLIITLMLGSIRNQCYIRIVL